MYKKINILGILSLIVMALDHVVYKILINYMPSRQIHLFIESIFAVIVFILWIFIYREFDTIFKTKTIRLYIFSISSWLVFSALISALGAYYIFSKWNHQPLNMILIKTLAVVLYIFITVMLTTIQYKFANQFLLMSTRNNSQWLRGFGISYKVAAVLLFALIGYVLFFVTHIIFNIYIIFMRKPISQCLPQTN